MTRLRLLIASSLLLALTALAPGALAESEAQSFVQGRQQVLLGYIEKQADADIARTFDEMLDYQWLAEQSLKDFWGERTPVEREQFQCALRQLVTDAHRRNLKKVLGYEVTFEGTKKANEGFLVTTVAKNRNNPREEPITIGYLVHKVDKNWRVYDIVTEGSSLVNNYRNQFRRIIKKHGYPDLVRRMKKKLGKAGETCFKSAAEAPKR